MSVTRSAGRFSDVAEGYAATMAPSLARIAGRVVQRAGLLPGERVLDVGTGTGVGARAALGDERAVSGIDAAPGMLAIARREVPSARFAEMDFHRLAFKDAAFDVVIAVHALLFAEDRVGALCEWRRVVRPRGRLSLSVPGPTEATPTVLYRGVYERFGIDTSDRYPTLSQLTATVEDAGWRVTDATADAGTEIRLPDDAAFATWRSIGSRGAATADWPDARHDALTAAMLAVTPRDAEGGLRIPFGALFVAAENPGEVASG